MYFAWLMVRFSWFLCLESKRVHFVWVGWFITSLFLYNNNDLNVVCSQLYLLRALGCCILFLEHWSEIYFVNFVFFPWKPGIMFWISFHQGSRLGVLCTWLPSNCTKSSDLSDCLLVTYYLNYFVTPFISVSAVSFLCFSAKSLEKLRYYFKSYNVLYQHDSP